MRILFILFLCCGSLSLQAQPKSRAASSVIQIANNGSTTYRQAVVEIPWKTVLAAYPEVDTTQLQVVQIGSGKEIAYQLERKGTKDVQNLLVQVSVEPRQQIQLTLQRGKPTPVTPQTYCRYVPERYDDFAWENDRIAFRIYGDALSSRPDNAYGTDVWSKRTNQLVINKWYKSGDYHKDHGEGLDYYKVGFTLGAGDIGVFLGDTIGYIHNYKSWEVLDNGPLRSTFRVKFAPSTFGGVTVNTTKTFSLDAGSQLNRVEVLVAHTHSKPLPMVAGITLRGETGDLGLDMQKGVLSYWEPTHGADGTIGVGCVFVNRGVPMNKEQGHGLAKFTVKSGEPVVYYTGAAWDKAGLITSNQKWLEYLNEFAAQQKQPLTITVGKATTAK